MMTNKLGSTGKEIFHRFADKCCEYWPYVYVSALFEYGGKWHEVQAFHDPLKELPILLVGIEWHDSIPITVDLPDRLKDSFHDALSNGEVEIAVRPKPGYESGAERSGMLGILLERDYEKIEG